jgi:fatty-acyl-CoA synthase
MTYVELGQMVGRFARMLKGRGVGSGDVVSILATNRPEMLAAHYAVPMLGAVLNTINTRLNADTVRYIVEHAESRLLLHDDERKPLAAAVAAQVETIALT